MSATPIDLRPDYLTIVRAILHQYVPDREVWAFGSRVTGTAKQTSDLDLAVIGEKSIDRDDMAQLQNAFSESSLPMKVDVVDWATVQPNFRRIIERQKVVVYAGKLHDPRPHGETRQRSSTEAQTTD